MTNQERADIVSKVEQIYEKELRMGEAVLNRFESIDEARKRQLEEKC